MDVIAILGLVSKLVPVAKDILAVIEGASTVPSPTSEVLNLVDDLTPKLAALMEMLDTIKNQTQGQYPQVWAQVSSDYKDASDAFEVLKAARGL